MSRAIILMLLAVLASLTVAACGSDAEAPAPAEPPAAPAAAAEGQTAPADESDGSKLIVKLEDPGGSGSYTIEPSEFVFDAGETVTFALTSETEFHNFVVDELGIDQSVEAGETVEFTFAFNKPGTYSLICVPHETLGMVGTITVQ